jgi:hypothetical protein
MSAVLWTEKRYVMPAWTQAFATGVRLKKGGKKDETDFDHCIERYHWSGAIF